MNREQLLLNTKLYASLAAAKTCASFTTALTWIANRCDDANTYFLTLSTKYRR
jgi:hypothetical protein